MYPFICNIKNIEMNKTYEDIRQLLLHNITSMFFVKVTGIVINNTSTILVSMINTLMVGICANYLTISGQLKSLISIFHNALLHSVGIASAEKSEEEKIVLFQRILLLNTFVVGLVATCLGVLWNDFIILWIGKQYLIDEFIFWALLINFAWYLFTAPLWIFRDASGLFKNVKFVLGFNGILNLALSFSFGQYLGVAGVFIGAVIADFCTNFWYDSNLVFRKVFKVNNALIYQKQIIENIITLLVMQSMINYITIDLQINIFNWFLKAFIAVSIYLLWFVFRYGKKNVMNNLNYIRHALKNN